METGKVATLVQEMATLLLKHAHKCSEREVMTGLMYVACDLGRRTGMSREDWDTMLDKYYAVIDTESGARSVARNNNSKLN